VTAPAEPGAAALSTFGYKSELRRSLGLADL